MPPRPSSASGIRAGRTSRNSERPTPSQALGFHRGVPELDHPVADVPSVEWFVPAPASGDEGDLALHRGVGTVDIFGFEIDLDQVWIRQRETLKLLWYDIFRVVNQLLYGFAPHYSTTLRMDLRVSSFYLARRERDVRVAQSIGADRQSRG